MEKTTIRYAKTDNTDEYIRILYAKEGNTESIKHLWDSHVNMIHAYIYRNYHNTKRIESDELVSESFFYFMDSIRKFDIDKGFKFSTYLYRNLQQISRYVVQNKTLFSVPADYATKIMRGQCIELESVSTSELLFEDGRTFEEVIKDDDSEFELTESLEKSEVSEYINDLLSMLNADERQVIQMRLIEDKPIDVIKSSMNITLGRYRTLYENAIAKMQSVDHRKMRQMIQSISNS